METVQRFNEKLATKITSAVSTMACAWLFAAIALVGLPQAIHDAFHNGFHPLPLVQWFSTTFLQLVLLSIIMVGQRVLQNQHVELHAKVDELHVKHDRLAQAVYPDPLNGWEG